MKKNILANYFELAIKRKMYSNESNLRFHLNYIFDTVDLNRKMVLDIGGGAGLLTFYAAVKGAENVVCLEPECDGSSSGMIDKFEEFRSQLSTSLSIERLPIKLQEYLNQDDDKAFDVVVLHASINHLDEEACINLRNRDSSYRIYKEIFTGVYNKMKKGGILIAADCTCHNFFRFIGIKNIFCPTIEWHKHQKPGTWISLLKEIGFKNPKVEWSTPNRFGNVGRFIMGNFPVAYLTTSHFKFTMEKSE